MTNDEMRIAVAEWMGWSEIEKLGPNGKLGWPYGGMILGRNPADRIIAEIPDYAQDLNAIHEAEKKLSNKDVIQYGLELSTLICKQAEATKSKKAHSICDWHATASQRCEALLRTIGKWKDNPVLGDKEGK